MSVNNIITYKDLPIATPALGLDYYQKSIQRSLNFSNLRKENYKKYINYKNYPKTSKLDFFPIRLDIENVSRCNFKCDMCIVSQRHKGKRAGDLSIENFKKIIDEFYSLVEIKLHGFGEPLMQGEDYFRMIEYAKSKIIWVRMVTNGSLLHLKDNYKKLIDTNTDEIQISIDGATKKVFEKIRKGSSFEQILKNCENINRYAKDNNRNVTKAWCVLQKDNYREFFEIIKICSEIGFKQIVFSLDLHGSGSSEQYKKNLEKNILEKINIETLKEGIKFGLKKNIIVQYWYINKKFDKKNICPWPFEWSFISSDSRIIPCCMIGNPDYFEIKSDEKEFRRKWLSKEYEEFRFDHLNNNIPEVCKNCYK
jgi:pyrroloquinoline quinone biosynthesis protein E